MALVKPWPTDAVQGVVSIADSEPDSGSRALQATPLQAPFLDPMEIEDEDEFEDEAVSSGPASSVMLRIAFYRSGRAFVRPEAQ